MPHEHVVSTKLTLEDEASHVLEHIHEGFEHVGEEAHEVGKELEGIFKSAVGTALGFELAGAVETFKSIGEEIFHAATGLEEQEKSIRGVLMITDKAGTSLEEMTTQAHELNEQFAHMAVETGATKESLISAFDEMAERTGLATEDVSKLTGQMANAGRAVPGGVGALSSGFSMMAQGMIRARNPIVQLIAATGVLHGNARDVAKQMQKMSPQHAAQLGLDAIRKMSEKMKDVPLTFNETIASMKSLREEIYESLGAPVLKALSGPLTQLRKMFRDNSDEINKWAEEVGKDAGEWVKDAAKDIKEGFHYLEAHSAEIKADIKEAMSFVRETVEFLIDHREAIAIAWGASKLPGIAQGITSAAGGAAALLKPAMALGSRMAGKSFGVMGALSEGAASATAAGVAGAVAAEGAATAVSTVAAESAVAGVAAAEGTAAATAAGGVGLFGTGVGIAGTGAAASALALGVFAAAIGGVGAAIYNGVQLFDEAVLHNGNVLDLHAKQAATLRAAQVGNTREVERMTTELYKAGQASDAWIASMTSLGEKVRNEIAMNAQAEASGYFGASIGGRDKAREAAFAEALAWKKAHKKEEKIKAPPVQNFFGGVHIQQDFKNIAPDRIAIIFKKALAGSAHAKTMAATATPHTAF